MFGFSSDPIQKVAHEELDKVFSGNSIDLISKPLGSEILAVSDEWFAAAENLTTPTAPIRKVGVFTHAGAWYDGWETRRHNPNEFDWVVIKLGVASGKFRGFEVDTAHFSGNHAPEIAVQAFFAGSNEEADEMVKDPDFGGWETILPKQECGPSCRQAWKLEKETEKPYTHVRLQMFPDGGIARFRAFGVPVPVFPEGADDVFDLAAAKNGGVAVSCSDQHFGTKDNLLLPGRGVDMGDGWETKRTRGEHIDWVIVRLGTPGEIDRVVVDTAHFRGNFPKEFQIFAGDFGNSDPGHDDSKWVEILEPTAARPDEEHEFEAADLKDVAVKQYTHVKLVIIPDGGVKRLRVFGRRRAW
ncbi:putative allantoicase protein [Lasiodiplodia theobromae]|uniref:allantoicase n=1 Tax=Lasiodiplodia theobromae TaxID=45133 RepID=A0A5N5D327_9PEZI|nr:Allantoicase [Lasiodiplodia theobromae]KAF9634337.1 putative allantoicase protein [Lasiodiplodia theobromae]